MPDPRSALLRRICAINAATAGLPNEISTASAPAVARWLKADLALLGQLRTCLREEYQKLDEAALHGGQDLAMAIATLDATIAAKGLALDDLSAQMKTAAGPKMPGRH